MNEVEGVQHGSVAMERPSRSRASESRGAFLRQPSATDEMN